MAASDDFDALTWLQDWYVRHCNGDWEHHDGVTLESLDNPGWQLTLDLHGTGYEDMSLAVDRFLEKRDDNDWIAYRLEAGKLIGACGPRNLPELIRLLSRHLQ